ncbi:hypothetical protein [Clostridium akagii]|nr:hypothetical protein [Clostridium akagii]
MQKQQWVEPKINELGVENTEYGTKVTSKSDATYQQGKFTFYSFS